MELIQIGYPKTKYEIYRAMSKLCVCIMCVCVWRM